MALMKLATKQRAAFGDRLSELTTVFTSPCPVTWLLTTTKVPSQYPPFPTTGPSSCDPPSWAENISQKGFAYYSPAICPLGFSVGCTASDKRADDGFPAITSGETAMYCVPSGFTCTSDTTDFRGGVWGFMRTASASGASVTVGPAIQIRWREEDLSSLQTDPLIPAAPVIGVNPIASSTSLTAVIPSTTETLPTTATNLPLLTTLTEVDTGKLPTFIIISTETGVPSSTPLPVKSSQQGTAASIQPISTSTTNGGSTQSSDGIGGDTSSTATSTNTAAMALSGILIVILFGFLAVTLLRRYRRYRTGKIDSFLPPCMRLCIRNFVRKWKSGEPSHRAPGNLSAKDLEAELGTDGPIPELGPGNPLGTKENPAELVGSGGARNSWMSQVSRIFTTKMRKEMLSA
ncbi:hypothetical protein F4776DRAFT_474420 [Hypoxylon sp. NC0597]|nr:hypothetical protein F4776DRAFT_474420 [Hypoxylon sp. NC0597]